MNSVVWQPKNDAWDRCALGAFASRWRPDAVGDYQALWQWSVDDLDEFWLAIWKHFDIASDIAPTTVQSNDPMPGTTWFDGVSINYAEHMLRDNGLQGDEVAIVSRSQSRADISLTLDELREQVRFAAAGLRRLGVEQGDRVAAYLPNVHEAIVGF